MKQRIGFGNGLNYAFTACTYCTVQFNSIDVIKCNAMQSITILEQSLA